MSSKMLALPIFPASHPASIVGACELNFCVRDGNRWTLTAINTNLLRKAFASLYVKALSSSNSFSSIALNTLLVKHYFLLPSLPRLKLPRRFWQKEKKRNRVSFRTCAEANLAQLFSTGDPYRIRTDVNGVRGRCLNHLTNGPLVHLHGLEPGTH